MGPNSRVRPQQERLLIKARGDIDTAGALEDLCLPEPAIRLRRRGDYPQVSANLGEQILEIRSRAALQPLPGVVDGENLHSFRQSDGREKQAFRLRHVLLPVPPEIPPH